MLLHTLGRFIRYYRPYQWLFWFDMVCALAVSAIDLAFPQILKTLTGGLFTQPAPTIYRAIAWVGAGLLLLYVVSVAHCLATGFSDKLRTRSYLHFLLLVNGLLFLLAFLQAWLCIQILPLLLIGVSLLSGHLFALSGGKAANIFFVVSLLLLLLLFVFNLWIFL